MKKVISCQGKESQDKIVSGVNKLADMVKLTLGPKGKNVVIDKEFAPPLITNDGVTIAREFFCVDPEENIGVKIIKEVSQKTNDLVGDGTTSSTVLAQSMLNEGIKLIDTYKECSFALNKGIDMATNFVLEQIKKTSKHIKDEKEIENVATISCQDGSIGKLLASAYYKLGKNGIVLLQDSPTGKTYLNFQEGLKIDRGYVSPYFCNDLEKGRFIANDCYLLIFDMKINNFNFLLPILEKLSLSKKPFIILCSDIEDEVLSGLIINKMRGNFNCCVVKAPFLGEKRSAILEDIACLSNTQVFNITNQDLISTIDIEDLGLLKQVKVTSEESVLSVKNVNNEKIEERKKIIENQIEMATDDFNKDELKLRLSNLTGNIAVVFVGAQTDIEQKEKKMRIEDAISATSFALSDGIVAGGGIALFKVKNKLEKYIKKIDKMFVLGAKIVLNSLDCPLKQILENAGVDSEKVIKKISENKNKNFGYDALHNSYCDMIKKGIIDPTKVIISELVMSTSVVKMLLSTSGLICETN